MATCSFIKESKQTVGAMGRVLRYVSQEKKTVDPDGREYLSGINCGAEVAQQSFMATKNLYSKASGTFFYHYVQSFSPQENVTPAQAHQIALELAVLAILKAADTGENFWIIIACALAVFAVVQIIQDTFLVPKIMGKITGLNPAIILLSLSIWGSLMGMLGMIIALPLTTLMLSYPCLPLCCSSCLPPFIIFSRNCCFPRML